ncbi:MFS transporter [Izhakiella capsodis]|nr:MFS transporter [Izhakiella capsodis]
MSTPLIVTQLQEREDSERYIGLNAAMQAIGVFAVVLLLPRYE